MNANALALAQLLSVLLPMGAKIYTEIQQANQGELKPIEQVLASADADWDAVIRTAREQLAAVPPK